MPEGIKPKNLKTVLQTFQHVAIHRKQFHNCLTKRMISYSAQELQRLCSKLPT